MLQDSNLYNCYVLIAFEATYRSYGSIHWRNLQGSNLCVLADSCFPSKRIYHSAKVP